MKTLLTIESKNASQIAGWIMTRRGVAEWRSIDLSDLDFRLLTPARSPEGNPTAKPHWKVDSTPAQIIEVADFIEVARDREVKRFHVAVRLGGNGLALKLTDGASRRVRRALAQAGDGSFNRFDYATQEAVIYKPDSTESLSDWIKSHEVNYAEKTSHASQDFPPGDRHSGVE